MAYYNKTGRHLTEEHKAKLRGKRRPRTPEERAKISRSLTGVPKTEAHRNAISAGTRRRIKESSVG